MHREIGPYIIEAELGRGGMGVVYRAQDTKLGRTVAIKALPPELADDAARLERFEREARTLAQLNHPNLVGIYGLEEHGGRRYLVLEFVEGETLAERLDRGPLDGDDAVRLGVQIAAGVAAAHDAGVIHRDLKPANIIVTPDGNAKVLDFGLARADDGLSSTGSGLSQTPTLTAPERAQNSPTIPGAIMGTAAYMSPEQARGRRVDRRTDVWSFGVVLYEMLVGASPFVGETAGDSIGAVLHKSFDLAHLPKDTPAGVRRVLGRCLQRDRDLRFRDLHDVRLELTGASLDAEPAAASRRLGPAAVVGAVVVGALLLAGGLLVGREVLAPKPAPSRPMYIAVPVENVSLGSKPGRGFFDISPDGTRLAYVATEPNDSSDDPITSIYLRDLDQPEPVRLEGTDGATWLSFDPTGRYLAYAWKPLDEGRWEMRRIAVDGRAPNTVFRDPLLYELADAPCWLGSDRIAVRGDNVTSIHLVPASGGTPEKIFDGLENIPDIVALWGLRGDPDGRHLFFAARLQPESGQPHTAVYDLDTQTGKARRLIDDGGNFFLVENRYAVYVRQNVVLAARWDAATRSLAGPAVPVMTDPGDDTVGRISDGGALAYSTADDTDDLGRIMAMTRDGEVSPVSGTRRVFSGVIQASPDGTRLAVVSRGESGAQVSVMDVANGYLRRAADFPISLAPTWMPDGRLIFAKVLSAQDWRHYIVDLDAGTPPTPLFGTDEPRGYLYEANPSADGSLFIMNVVSPVTADSDVYAVVAETGEQHPLVVSDDDNRNGSLSPDGRLLAYLSGTSGIRKVTLRTFDRETMTVGPPRPVSTGASGAPIWSADGTKLYWHDHELERFVVVSVEYPPDARPGAFRVGPPEVLFTRADTPYQPPGSDYPISVSPDGETFYFPENRQSLEDPQFVNVILNWDVELERALKNE